jgi:hypothetical protein
MDEERYLKLVVRVAEALAAIGKAAGPLGAAIGSLDGPAVARLALPDVRALLADLERVTPPVRFAALHASSLVVLRDCRRLRSNQGQLAEALRTVKQTMTLINDHLSPAMDSLAEEVREVGNG